MKKVRMKKVRWMGLVTVVALLLLGVAAACAKPAAPAPTVTVTKTVTVTPTPTPTVRPAWQLDPAIVAAAKKEGAVVIVGFLGAEDQRALRTAFNKEYPEIKLEFLTMRGAEAEARLRAEKAVGKGTMDLQAGSMSTAQLLDPEGIWEYFEAPESKNPNVRWTFHPYYSEPLAYGTPMTTLTSRHHHGVAINTNLVPTAQEPKTWNELFTDPKWQGKMVMGGPNKGSALAVAYFFFWKKDTQEPNMDLIKKVQGQKIFYSDAESDLLAMLGRGEYAVMIGAHTGYLSPLIKAGMPLKFIIPQEGVTAAGWYVNLVKLAPHPNAGKLFINWLLTENGQMAWVEAGRMPIREGIPVPAWFPTVPAERAPLVLGQEFGIQYVAAAKAMGKAFGL